VKSVFYEAIFVLVLGLAIVAFWTRGCSNVGCATTSIDGATTNER